MPDQNSDDKLRDILNHAHTVAVVGMSNNPTRASFEVGDYLQKQGYRVLPVNPTIDRVLELPVYKSLREIGEHVDVVDIFRKPEDVPVVVEEAIEIGAGAIWMQLGIVNEEAAQRARDAGLDVVMDHCMMKEHRRLIGEGEAHDTAMG